MQTYLPKVYRKYRSSKTYLPKLIILNISHITEKASNTAKMENVNQNGLVIGSSGVGEANISIVVGQSASLLT